MTLDIDDALATVPPEPATSMSTGPGRRCRRHQWGRYEGPESDYAGKCLRCGAWYDEARSKRGKSSARLGKDQERRIERVYGPRKVGEFGDAVDLLGATWKWQSKATRGEWPAWLERVGPVTWVPGVPGWIGDPIAAMLPLSPHLLPLLIRSRIIAGVGTTDRIIVRAFDWLGLHGLPDGCPTFGYVAMSGSHFLDVHGRDDPDRHGVPRDPEAGG